MFYAILVALLVSAASGGTAVEAKISPRIASGTKAKEGEFSYVVSILKYNNGNFVHSCGGAIISANSIITAARCLDDPKEENYKVRAGTIYLEDSTELLDVSQVIRHPKYETSSDEYDIALLTLKDELNFTNNNIQTIGLPDEKYTPKALTKCVVTGWGATSIVNDLIFPELSRELIMKEVKIVPEGLCRISHPKVRGKQLCAFNAICKGDIGSPLVCYDTGHKYLAGIASFEKDLFGCGIGIAPDVYTKVSEYISWILQKNESN